MPEQAKEELAYTIGTQAYVYGYPWIYLPTLRWLWVTKPVNPARSPYAAINHFWNLRELADASYRDGGSPNNDTLYSIAWVDVSKQPVILSHPDMGERYFTFELASLDSDTSPMSASGRRAARPGALPSSGQIGKARCRMGSRLCRRRARRPC